MDRVRGSIRDSGDQRSILMSIEKWNAPSNIPYIVPTASQEVVQADRHAQVLGKASSSSCTGKHAIPTCEI